MKDMPMKILIAIVMFIFTCSTSAQTFGSKFYIALPETPTITDTWTDNIVTNYIDDNGIPQSNFTMTVQAQSVYHLLIRSEENKVAKFRVRYWAENQTSAEWKYLHDPSDVPTDPTVPPDTDEWMYVAPGSTRVVAVMPFEMDENSVEHSTRVPIPSEKPNLSTDTVPLAKRTGNANFNSRAIVVETCVHDEDGACDDTQYGTVAVTLAHIDDHLWFDRLSYTDFSDGNPNDPLDYVRNSVVTNLPSTRQALCHVLPVESLGTKYLVSPSIPGRRALGYFGTCIVGTSNGGAATSVTLTPPPAMPESVWGQILVSLGESFTGSPPPFFEFGLEEGEVLFIADYADRKEDYIEHYDNPPVSTRFDAATGPSVYAGLKVEASAPVAILNVEHGAYSEISWYSDPNDDFPITLDTEDPQYPGSFTLHQTHPYEAAGLNYLIPISNPFITTGHNIRVMAFSPETTVTIYRHDFGHASSGTPLATYQWESSTSNSVLDIEPVSITNIGNYGAGDNPSSGVTQYAYAIETDEVIAIHASHPVTVLIAPRGDKNNGRTSTTNTDPDLVEGGGSETCAAFTSSGQAVGSYAIQVPPVEQYGSESILSFSNTYEFSYFTTQLGLWTSYCPPPALGETQERELSRNYVTIIAHVDVIEDVTIAYPGYDMECGNGEAPYDAVNIQTKKVNAFPSALYECDAFWSEKMQTASGIVIPWQQSPGTGLEDYRYCVVQIPYATKSPLDPDYMSDEEARRDPQASTIRVYIDPDPTSPSTDNLLAAFLTGYMPKNTSDKGPSAYGLAGVPIRLPPHQVVVSDALLDNDAATVENTTAFGDFQLLDPSTLKWTLNSDDLPTAPGDSKILSYRMLVNDLPPSSLRQMSVFTKIEISELNIERTRLEDYLPVLADPWGLEITTDYPEYALGVTGTATSTIYPTPIIKREVFDTYLQIADPASHVLYQVTIEDPDNADVDNVTIPGTLALQRNGSAPSPFHQSGYAALVADAGRPVEWKDIKLVLGDSIGTDGNPISSSAAGTSVSVRVRTANTLTDLYNKRADTTNSSQIEIETSVIASGDYALPDDLAISRFLEVEVELVAGPSLDYSPTIESVYASHRPASLELAVQIEDPDNVGVAIADLGAFNLSDAELASAEVVRNTDFSTGALSGSGDYIARATIRDGLNGEELATATSPFEVLPETPQTVFGTVAIEPDILNANEYATIASVINNPNQLVTIDNIDVEIRVVDDLGNEVTTTGSSTTDPLPYNYTIAELSPGNEDVRPIQIVASGALTEGEYTVYQDVSSSAGDFVTQTDFFVRSSVSDLAGLAGTLSVGASPIGPANENPMISATLTNTGNEDLTNVQLKFEFPHPAGSPNDQGYDPYEYVFTVGSLAIGETVGDGDPTGDDPIMVPLADLYSTDGTTDTGLLAGEGLSYPISLYATSNEHITAATGTGLDHWVPLAVNAFLIRTGPGQVSLRRYIPIVLEPQGADLASEGFGLNRHGDAVGVSIGSTEYPAGTQIETSRASLWPMSRDVQDLHESLLSEHGLTGSLVATSNALNINKDGYIVGQLDNDGNWIRSFIALATDDDSDPSNPLDLTFDELLPSTLNSNQANAFVTDISDELMPTAVGYEIAALTTAGSAGALAAGDPGLIGSSSTGGEEFESGSITPGEGVSSSTTSSGGTALQGPGGSPSSATTSVPSAIYWPGAHSDPGRATKADLSTVSQDAKASRFWAVNRDGEAVGDWFDGSKLNGLMQSPSWEASDGGNLYGGKTTFRGIGSIGHIVGWSGNEPNQQSFQIRPNGEVSGLVPVNGLGNRFANAINGNGEAAGSAGEDDDQAASAWANTTYHNPYESFTASPRTPWSIREIRDINDSGQMIGTAEIPSILLGKGVPTDSDPIAVPEPMDVGSFFADSEGSGQDGLEALSESYFAFANTDAMEGPLGINTFFGGVLNVDSVPLQEAEVYGEVFFAPSSVGGITVTPVIDQGFGLRSFGVVRLSQIQADPTSDPIVWAVEAIQNAQELMQEHSSGSPGYWSSMAGINDNPPIDNEEDYRMPIYLDFTSGSPYEWMATEPFVFYVIPNNTPADFLNDATDNGQDGPSMYASNLMAASPPWYPGPPVPVASTEHRPPIFSIAAANPESKDQMLSFNGSRTDGSVIETISLFTYELISRNSELQNGKGSDRDFNDLLITVEPSLESPTDMQRRGIILDPVRFDVNLLDRIRLWARSDVGVIPNHDSPSDSTSISRWWDFGTWDHPFGVAGTPQWEAVGGHNAHPGIRLDGVDDELEAVDIRYTDAAQADGSFDEDLGDFVGDATLLLVLDLNNTGIVDITDVPVFSTDKQLLRNSSIDPAAERGRLGLTLDANGDLVFQTQKKTDTATIQSTTHGTSFGSALSANTVILGLKVTGSDVYAIVNQTESLFGGSGDLSATVRPVWTDITIGENLAGDHGAFVVREVMMFDRGLNPEELEDITDYLMERYSISP